MSDAERHRLYLRGRWVVILSGVVMSISGPLVRMLEAASAWQFLSYRSIAVVVVVGLILLHRHGRGLPAVLRAGGVSTLIGGVFLAGAFTSIVFSLLATTIANALFIFSTAPLITALLGWVFLGEHPSRITWLAILVAIIGVLVMVGEGIAEGDLFGDLTALSAAICFALYSVVIRRGRAQEMAPSVFYAAVLAGGIAALAALWTGQGLTVSTWDIGVSFTYGGVGIGGGLLLYTVGSKYVPAAELNLLSLGEVVLSPIWVWLAFAEVPSTPTLIGGAILIVALATQARADALN